MANKVFSREEAIKLRNRGLSHKEIAEIMGASKAWVAKELVGVPKGVERKSVDETRIKAILLAREFLKKLEAL